MGDFILVRDGPFQQTHRGDGAQNPGQLCDLRHVALQEETGAGGVQAAGEKIQRDAPVVFAQFRRVLHAVERVVIGDEIKRLALGLERDGGTHRAEVVAEVEDAGRLDAREDAFHGGGSKSFAESDDESKRQRARAKRTRAGPTPRTNATKGATRPGCARSQSGSAK